MCLACQMEGEWLAYLEQLAQQEAQQGPATVAPSPAAAATPAPGARFVCDEPPPE